MATTLRYTRAADNSRPRGAHRYDVWSPKIQRRLTLFGALSLQAWVAIEGNPSIQAFCERPLVSDHGKPSRVIDFWVGSHSGDEIWVLFRSSELGGERGPAYLPALQISAESEGMSLKACPVEHVALGAVAFNNWRVALHYLTANHDLIQQPLVSSLKRTLQTAGSAETIRRIEHLHGNEDPVLVRAALFFLLHRGQVIARDFGSVPLGPMMGFEAI